MISILPQLELLLYRDEREVNKWFDAAWANLPPVVYSSVDVRHAGFKVAPVDTNLFPAGFNNLSHAARIRTSDRWRQFFKRAYPEAKRVLLIPENHTRNMGYLDNLSTILRLLLEAGMEVRLGSLVASADSPYVVSTTSGEVLKGEVLTKKDGKLQTAAGFVPDVIFLNNDLSSGVHELLEGISQPIIPALAQGWHNRRKRNHFAAYDAVAKRFANAFEMDPWLISAHFSYCGAVDFKERSGMECVAIQVEKVLRATAERYAFYGIEQEPYAYIKADAGTYGMGIMTVKSGDEVMNLNKKNRNKMNVIKEGVEVTEVLVQEGVPSVDVVEKAPAEPVIYLADSHAIGGAYRVNSERDALNNLNAAGMRFVGMCDEVNDEVTGKVPVKDCNQRAFGLIAELATLAAAQEDLNHAEEAA